MSNEKIVKNIVRTPSSLSERHAAHDNSSADMQLSLMAFSEIRLADSFIKSFNPSNESKIPTPPSTSVLIPSTACSMPLTVKAKVPRFTNYADAMDAARKHPELAAAILSEPLLTSPVAPKDSSITRATAHAAPTEIIQRPESVPPEALQDRGGNGRESLICTELTTIPPDSAPPILREPALLSSQRPLKLQASTYADATNLALDHPELAPMILSRPLFRSSKSVFINAENQSSDKDQPDGSSGIRGRRGRKHQTQGPKSEGKRSLSHRGQAILERSSSGSFGTGLKPSRGVFSSQDPPSKFWQDGKREKPPHMKGSAASSPSRRQQYTHGEHDDRTLACDVPSLLSHYNDGPAIVESLDVNESSRRNDNSTGEDLVAQAAIYAPLGAGNHGDTLSSQPRYEVDATRQRQWPSHTTDYRETSLVHPSLNPNISSFVPRTSDLCSAELQPSPDNWEHTPNALGPEEPQTTFLVPPAERPSVQRNAASYEGISGASGIRNPKIQSDAQWQARVVDEWVETSPFSEMLYNPSDPVYPQTLHLPVRPAFHHGDSLNSAAYSNCDLISWTTPIETRAGQNHESLSPTVIRFSEFGRGHPARSASPVSRSVLTLDVSSTIISPMVKGSQTLCAPSNWLSAENDFHRRQIWAEPFPQASSMHRVLHRQESGAREPTPSEGNTELRAFSSSIPHSDEPKVVSGTRSAGNSRLGTPDSYDDDVLSWRSGSKRPPKTSSIWGKSRLALNSPPSSKFPARSRGITPSRETLLENENRLLPTSSRLDPRQLSPFRHVDTHTIEGRSPLPDVTWNHLPGSLTQSLNPPINASDAAKIAQHHPFWSNDHSETSSGWLPPAPTSENMESFSHAASGPKQLDLNTLAFDGSTAEKNDVLRDVFGLSRKTMTLEQAMEATRNGYRD